MRHDDPPPALHRVAAHEWPATLRRSPLTGAATWSKQNTSIATCFTPPRTTRNCTTASDCFASRPGASGASADILARLPRHLRREAARLDVDPGRVVFAGREPMARHLARMSLADMALDPFHVSGGATSVATLSAGVPVLTLRGRSFLARMGSSINARLGMAELDCATPEQYVTKAVELATDPAALAAIRARLGKARQTHPFFNTRAFARTLEEALRLVWERHEAGLLPADIRVADASPR